MVRARSLYYNKSIGAGVARQNFAFAKKADKRDPLKGISPTAVCDKPTRLERENF